MDAETPIQEKPIIVGGINTSLTPRQFYRGDPYLVFVKDKLRLDDIWNTAIFFVLAIAIDFSFDIFFLKDYHPTASLLDALKLLLLCTALTSAYFIYLLLPSFMAETFDTLNANGVIGTQRQNSSKSVSYESFVEKLLAWANSWWWLAIIAMITVLYGFQWMFVQYPHIPLFWNIFVFLVGNILVVYIFCFILIRVILLLVFINRLFFLFNIQVKMLHPDGSGGLGSLEYILWISVGMMLAFSLGILAITQRVTSPVLIIVITVTYLVFILALVIGWLVLPHRVMLQARKELLQPITDEYEQAVKETLASITGDTATIEAGTERLNALQDRYKLLRDNFPIWPLQVRQMRRLVIALILPILLSFIPSLLEFFVKK